MRSLPWPPAEELLRAQREEDEEEDEEEEETAALPRAHPLAPAARRQCPAAQRPPDSGRPLPSVPSPGVPSRLSAGREPPSCEKREGEGLMS